MAGEPDDRTLMLQYRDGDARAFEVLYGRHKGPLYRYFLRQCGDRDTSAELFQEVWTKIIRARDKYQPSAKFSTYMYHLAHNILVDHFRRSSRNPLPETLDPLDPDDLAAMPGDETMARAQRLEFAERLRSALSALPWEQQEAFLLREESGMSLAEIAELTSVKEETAKSRLRYAVRKLRAALTDGGDTP